MKRVWMLFAVLILIAACAKSVSVSETPQSNEKTAGQESQAKEVTVTLPAEFKLIQETATRNPAVVKGIVKNIGNGTGSVKVTARVYYAKVVSGEEIQTIEN